MMNGLSTLGVYDIVELVYILRMTSNDSFKHVVCSLILSAM